MSTGHGNRSVVRHDLDLSRKRPGIEGTAASGLLLSSSYEFHRSLDLACEDLGKDGREPAKNKQSGSKPCAVCWLLHFCTSAPQATQAWAMGLVETSAQSRLHDPTFLPTTAPSQSLSEPLAPSSTPHSATTPRQRLTDVRRWRPSDSPRPTRCAPARGQPCWAAAASPRRRLPSTRRPSRDRAGLRHLHNVRLAHRGPTIEPCG